MIKVHIEKYLKLRDEIDNKCASLWEIHKKNMLCSEGCSSCCQAFKILPIEFFAMEILLKEINLPVNTLASKDECKFLVKNKCAIYEHRPVICRTHGFPLVRLNEDDESFEVAFCQLNFKDYNLEKFKKGNVYFEEKFNVKLFKLNQKFLSTYPSLANTFMGLLELNKLNVNIV